MNVREIAIACHNINRAFCKALGDDSQTKWSSAPDWQKESAIEGVKFNIENPDAPASASHDSWLKQKEDDGWKYGAIKDAELKEHPCFVSYEELPLEQQAKDHLFKQTVKGLAHLITT